MFCHFGMVWMVNSFVMSIRHNRTQNHKHMFEYEIRNDLLVVMCGV